MKKMISVVLAAALVLSVAACGTSGNVPSQESTSGVSEEVSSSESESAEAEQLQTTVAEQSENDDVDQPQTTVSEQNETAKPDTPANEDTLPEFQKEATITETILYDENDVRIIATDLTYNNYAAELAVTIENNSDKDLDFISNSAGYSCNSVNGYMIEDGYMNCDVAAGKKAKDTISISYNTLMLYGIFEIADLEVGFSITDDDYNRIYTGSCQIMTSAADQHDYQKEYYKEAIVSAAAQNNFGYTVPYFSDEPLYDQDGFAIVSSTIMMNGDGEDMLLLEVKNTTEKTVNAVTSDICINGLGIYGSTWSSDTINPGNTAIVVLDLSRLLNNDYRDVYGVQDVGTVDLTMKFEDVDGEEVGSPAEITVENPNVEPSFSKEGQEVYNANDIRIVMKDIVEDSSEYSKDMYILLLAENNGTEPVTLRGAYDSFSLNGYMMSFYMNQVPIKGGDSAMLEIYLMESDLEENSIAEISDITQMEMEIEIMQEYNTIDTAKLVVDFN